jgi:hypothetical protein
MRVSWFACGVDGKPGFSTTQIDVPGRYNFSQCAIYRLKLTNIEGRPGAALYPTLEVVPSNSKTDPFLAHSSVPVEFTNEDFDQVAAGNYVVKVIYLPDPQFQDVAAAGGLEEIVSTRLEPGVDPIVEATRRGSILLVIRIGNIDLELENSPAMDAPNPYLQQMPKAGLGPMVPYLPGLHGPMLGGANPALGPGGALAGQGPLMGPNGPMMGGQMLPPNMVPPPVNGKPPTMPSGTGVKPPPAKQSVPVSKPDMQGPDLPLMPAQVPGQSGGTGNPK